MVIAVFCEDLSNNYVEMDYYEKIGDRAMYEVTRTKVLVSVSSTFAVDMADVGLELSILKNWGP